MRMLIAAIAALVMIGCNKPGEASTSGPAETSATAATQDPATQTADNNGDTTQAKDPSDATSERTVEDDGSKARRERARKSLGMH